MAFYTPLWTETDTNKTHKGYPRPKRCTVELHLNAKLSYSNMFCALRSVYLVYVAMLIMLEILSL